MWELRLSRAELWPLEKEKEEEEEKEKEGEVRNRGWVRCLCVMMGTLEIR